MCDSRFNHGRLVPNDFSKLAKYCSPESIAYLKESLKSLVHGRPTTISFPLYGRRDKATLKQILDLIEKSSLPEFIKEYEKTRAEKFGPQGGVPKWSELSELFKLYYTAPKPVTFVDPEVMDDMLRDYSSLHARKLSAVEALRHLKATDKIETRAAGWSEFQLKKTDPEAQALALKLANNGEWINGVGYTFARYNKLKYRLFMPMPFSSMIRQAQYYISFLGNIQMDLLQKGMKSHHTAWSEKIGFEHCFRIMEDEIHAADLKPNETLVYFSNDFEKMDTRTATDQYKKFVIPVISAAYHSDDPEISKAMLFTTTAPIISPEGTIIGNHGTASGAEVTNGGECIGNDYFQRRFLKLLRKKLARKWRLICRRVNGDDSILLFAITCSIAAFERALREALSQACNETGWDIQFDKLKISADYGIFCQNILYYDRIHHELNWYYPLVLTLNSIVNPEHQYKKSEWDKDYRDLDIVQKLDNSARHPLFEEFVQYVMAGLKYPLLGKSERETKRILGKYPKYRSLQSLGERYNRQDYDIRLSPTVKYVLSKR